MTIQVKLSYENKVKIYELRQNGESIKSLEVCARGLFDVARRELEPGWTEFPSAAADTIARRLGWDFYPTRCDDVP